MRTTSIPVIVTLLAAATIAGCGGPTPAVAETANAQLSAPLALAVDPCTLFTEAEVRTLLGEARSQQVSGGQSRNSCSLEGPSRRRSLHVAVFGDAQSAPSVFSEQLRSAAEPQKVLGVGRAAFAVFRADEVGIVVMTGKAVVTISLVVAQGTIADPERTLARMTPVVQQASARV